MNSISKPGHEPENVTRPLDLYCPIISIRDKAAASIAAKVMAAGGIVVYPTETSYALGCNGLDKDAVDRIYQIKGRDKSKPLPVIMADARMVSKFTVSTPSQRRLVEKFMPGPLTIAARKKIAIPASGSAKTIAFRIPSSVFARKVSAILGAPIVSTSANISGEAAIYEIGVIVHLFANRAADLIVDAGDLPAVPASTIVCLLGTPKILRQGPVSNDAVFDAIAAKNPRKKKGKEKSIKNSGKKRRKK
jgi:L-threonylcarbamoyladenylate synthase